MFAVMLLDFQMCSLFNCKGDNLINIQHQNAVIASVSNSVCFSITTYLSRCVLWQESQLLQQLWVFYMDVFD